MIIILFISQGIDGSAPKPAHVQDTEYMVEKTPYLGTFGLSDQYMDQKVFLFTKTILGMW